MKFRNKDWNSFFDISKELIKNIINATNETEDDVIFNLITLLDQKWTNEDIVKLATLNKKRARSNFGTFKVLTYGNIKIKCTIGYNPPDLHGLPNPFSGMSDKTEVYVKMTPATGQWIKMSGTNIKEFLDSKEKQITENLLLGSAQTSVKVPCQPRLQRQSRDQSSQRVQQLQALDDSYGSSAHTASSPASSKPLAHAAASSKQSEIDVDSLFSLEE